MSSSFIKSALQAAQPKSNRYLIYDRGGHGAVPGLCVCVHPSGRKSFQVYRRFKNRPKRITLGTFPGLTIQQARKQAISAIKQMNAGVDPNETKRNERSETITLRQALDDYIRDRKLRASTEDMYRRVISKHLSDWLDTPLAHITRERVAQRHRRISETSQVTANKAGRYLRAIFNYASGEYLDQKGNSRFPDNPVRQLSHRRMWHKEVRRDGRIRERYFIGTQFDAAVETVIKYLRSNDAAGAASASKAMQKKFHHLHHELMELVAGSHGSQSGHGSHDSKHKH